MSKAATDVETKYNSEFGKDSYPSEPNAQIAIDTLIKNKTSNVRIVEVGPHLTEKYTRNPSHPTLAAGEYEAIMVEINSILGN
jgi:hypothetical protein